MEWNLFGSTDAATEDGGNQQGFADRGNQQTLTVGRKPKLPDLITLRLDWIQHGNARSRVPKMNPALIRAGGESLSIRAEGHHSDNVVVS